MVFLCGLLIFRNAEAKDRQERANKILVNVKAGIEHLADKLQHLKAVRTLNIKKKGQEIVETDIYAFKKCSVLHNCDSEWPAFTVISPRPRRTPLGPAALCPF